LSSVEGLAGSLAGSPTNKFLSHPKKPFSAGAVAAGLVRLVAGVDGAVASDLAARGSACGAGKSGSTPLITGVCLLVGSCERRVTAVGSSISSAIL
jgi:hypothetical protein